MKEFLKSSIYKIIIVFVVIALDLVAKEYLYSSNYTILPYLIGTRTVAGLNTGGAFSMLSDKLWLLILTTCVFLVLICVYDLWAKDKNKLYGIALSFIVGGAIGNFIDRIFLGGVRDFIYFQFWQTFPTFNVADCFLFVGTVLMVIYAIFVYKPKTKAEKVETKNVNNADVLKSGDSLKTKKSLKGEEKLLKTENSSKNDKVLNNNKKSSKNQNKVENKAEEKSKKQSVKKDKKEKDKK